MHRSRIFLVGLVIIIGAFYPTLRVGLTGIKLLRITKGTVASATEYAQNFFSTNKEEQKNQAILLKNDLQRLDETLLKFNDQTSKSWLARRIIANKKDQLELAPDLLTITQKILTGKQTYVLLFQNSEEIRATGGFLGSYAKIELQDGQLINFKIEDIYVPDGQFGWFIEAPAGAREYLSGGDGLRLRDANWHPDFPTSAQQILTYLAFGKEAGIDGAVGVNLPIMEKILNITGPIYVHDYDQTITQNNFSDIARVNRDQFFPGSVQKQHFLTTFFNQLLIELQNLDQANQQLLVEEIIASTIEKNLQFFSNDQSIQSLFEKLQISGQIKKIENASYLMLVESNVGINKANQHIERAVDLIISDTQTSIEVTFTNNNLPPTTKNKNLDEADHLWYVNYQRIILSPETEVEEILFDDQKLTNWDEEIITNSNGERFKQIGFLITLPERETKKLSVDLSNSDLNQHSKVFIQKQAGLNQVLYHIAHFGQSFSIDLDKDTLVNLDN